MEKELGRNERLMEDGHGYCQGECADIDGVCDYCHEREVAMSASTSEAFLQSLNHDLANDIQNETINAQEVL